MAKRTAKHLVQVAVKALPQMLDEGSGLFCYRLKQSRNGVIREGISPRYTAMTLMGLHRLEQSGTASPLDTRAMLDKLLQHSSWVDNAGDLGLLLWACALLAPEQLDEISRRFDLARALSRYRDVKEGRTMELSWFLAGVTHAVLARDDMRAELRGPAYQAYSLVVENQGSSGVYSHLAGHASVAGKLRGRIGSFADQIYPIYALSRFYQAYGEHAALEAALRTARTICEAQGAQGQWWWHYDSTSGSVIDPYPVFSVHQHGMAPMSLLALSETSQVSFERCICKGLEWIHGNNELGFNMEDDASNVVWRCLFQPGLHRFFSAFSSRATEIHPKNNVKVRFECRPYELGWLLYGLAGYSAQSASSVRQQSPDDRQ